jgi:hypothetical protein
MTLTPGGAMPIDRVVTPAGGIGGYSDFGIATCSPFQPLDVPALNGAGPGTTYATLTFLMRGHLLAQGQLEGRFGRP